MSFEEFLKKQEGVYSLFKDQSQLLSEGLQPNLKSSEGGYAIAFRHGKEFTNLAEEISKKICNLAPSIKYDSLNMHTTISVFGVEEDFIPDNKVLEKLSELVDKISFSDYNVQIDYKDILMNQDSVILEGHSNEDFYSLSEQINECVAKAGIDLSFPWGAHVTINRFLEKVPLDRVEEVMKVIENSEISFRSKPVSVDVAYFNTGGGKFEFHTYNSFSLD